MDAEWTEPMHALAQEAHTVASAQAALLRCVGAEIGAGMKCGATNAEIAQQFGCSVRQLQHLKARIERSRCTSSRTRMMVCGDRGRRGE